MDKKVYESSAFCFMRIYVNEVYPVWRFLEILQNQLIKRFEKGKEVSFEKLVKSASMYRLARLSANAVCEFEEITPNREDKKEFRIWLTNTLIRDCKAVARS